MTEKKKSQSIQIKVSDVNTEDYEESESRTADEVRIIQELAKLDLIESILSDISFNTNKTVCNHCGVTQYESFPEHKAAKAVEGITGRLKQIRKVKQDSLNSLTLEKK